MVQVQVARPAIRPGQGRYLRGRFAWSGGTRALPCAACCSGTGSHSSSPPLSAYAAPMRRSPHEKKALSYAKDRRYAYGNNSKAARKAVPRRKRWVNKANRHAEQQFLAGARGPVDAVMAGDVEDRLRGRRPKRWRKAPDMPLGRLLELRRQRASE